MRTGQTKGSPPSKQTCAGSFLETSVQFKNSADVPDLFQETAIQATVNHQQEYSTRRTQIQRICREVRDKPIVSAVVESQSQSINDLPSKSVCTECGFIPQLTFNDVSRNRRGGGGHDEARTASRPDSGSLPLSGFAFFHFSLNPSWHSCLFF